MGATADNRSPRFREKITWQPTTVECEMGHAVMAEIHVYRFGKRSSLVDIFIYHVSNISYRVKKLIPDVIENFSRVNNSLCYKQEGKI